MNRSSFILKTAIAFFVITIVAALVFARPSNMHGTTQLAVWSATDEIAMSAIIRGFETRHPDIEVKYTEFNTSELQDAVLTRNEKPDLVISSAMDLQVQLVNLGLASPVSGVAPTPDWSRWRDELFGFTQEPVALIYNRDAFSNRTLPSTRSELAGLIRDDPSFYNGRIGTYDVALSGVGYMFATQDAQRGFQASRLTESLGRAAAKIYCCTSDMVKDVAEGRLVLAYNVIGSYALEQVRRDDRLGVLLLSDYALVFTRSVLVMKTSHNKDASSDFVRFLLSDAGQSLIEDHSSLFPLMSVPGKEPASVENRFEGNTSTLPIRLRPSLLTWLDERKKAKFLQDWRMSIGGRSINQR